MVSGGALRWGDCKGIWAGMVKMTSFPRLLLRAGSSAGKGLIPHPLRVVLPSQVLLINDVLAVPVSRERNQKVLSGRECARHLGLAFLMSYLCDPHKTPKEKMCPVAHTQECLHFVRETPESLKDVKTYRGFYEWDRRPFIGVESLSGIDDEKRGLGNYILLVLRKI